MTYLLRLQNDGNVTSSYTVLGSAGDALWTVRYFDALTAGTDITTLVTASGWASPALVRGAYRDLRVEVTPGSAVAVGVARAVRVTMQHTPTQADVVKAVTTRD